jgi:hypothetical protein
MEGFGERPFLQLLRSTSFTAVPCCEKATGLALIPICVGPVAISSPLVTVRKNLPVSLPGATNETSFRVNKNRKTKWKPK